MQTEIFGKSGLKCPYETCARGTPGKEGPKAGQVVRYGSFFRAHDSRRITRFRCLQCRRTFSRATLSPCFGQKKRRLNVEIRKLLCSSVSQRRAALILGINRKTVVRKFLFLAEQARLKRQKMLGEIAQDETLLSFQFDEMESFERSKCLPLSIPLAVHPGSRRIIGIGVGQMPANGLLAAISRRKYGPREDHRPQVAHALFSEIRSTLSPQAEITTDQNPKYPGWLRPHFPQSTHRQFKGRRGCVVGQGELKKIGFDPLFDLNHTCAMIRANVNRLARRTWCTTKKPERLLAHLELYADFHNEVLVA